jgi:serine/threonine protein kinase
MDQRFWEKLENLFQAAIERPPETWAAFLDEACANNSNLRRELELLLAKHVEAGSFLESPPFSEDGVPEQIAPLVDDQIGPYRIVSLLGAGGMGRVFRGLDTRLDRAVAIKFSSEHFSKRFEQEARTISALNHPHICTLYDIGVMPSGSGYIVTELVEGETLGDWLKHSPTVEHILEITRQVLDALRAAHAARIIHRDLKPANIMVRFDGYAKVLDFGLAKRILPLPAGAAEDAATSLTVAGQIVGTVAYMSPEQIKAQRLDHRSDLFAFGIILHEMLAGEHPWRRPSAVDMLYAIVHDDPPPLRAASLIGLSPIVQKLLRKDPAQRYQSAGDVLEALAHRAAVQNRPDVELREQQPKSTARVLTRLIVLPFRLLRRHEATDFLAVSLPDAITSSLAGIDSIVVRSTMVASRFTSILEFDVHAIAEQAQVDAILTGTILSDGEHLRVNTQLVEAPNGAVLWSNNSQASLQDIFQLQDKLVDQVIQSLSAPLTARERRELKHDVPASAIAYQLYLRANELALAGYDPQRMVLARDLYLRSIDADPKYAPSWVGLGRIYRLIGKYGVEDEMEYLKRADDSFQKAFALNPELAEAHNSYTSLQADLGRSLEAMERLLRRAQTHRHDPNLYAALVHACRYTGLLDASVAAHERTNELDPQVRTTVAYTYCHQGNFQKAIDCCGPGDGAVKALALLALGYKEEVMAMTKEIERTAPMPWLKSYALSHRALLEGDRETSLGAFNSFLALPNPFLLDPEGRFWIGRDLAELSEWQRALTYLSMSLDGNYCCYYVLMRDAALESLRSHPGFTALVERARELDLKARRVFIDNGGEELLGISLTI